MAKAKKGAAKKAAKRSRPRPELVEEEEQDEKPSRTRRPSREEDLDEEDEQEDREEEEEQPRPKKSKKGEDEIVESPISIKARRSKLEPADIANYKSRKTRRVTLVATHLGFDGEKRIRPGAKFGYDAPLDEEGRVVLPSWAVLEKDYTPEEPLQLPPGMRPKVRGGATVGGVKPNL